MKNEERGLLATVLAKRYAKKSQEAFDGRQYAESERWAEMRDIAELQCRKHDESTSTER